MTEEKLVELLNDMSLQEKIDQMLQTAGRFYLAVSREALLGNVSAFGIPQKDMEDAGSILGTDDAKSLIEIQKKQMEKQPHHIPMLFMMDVIHGMRTIFPMPLAQAATFDPELAKKCASVSASEAYVSGLHVTFSPMADLVRDPRWGRVMESFGEDPYLSSLMCAGVVQGFQDEDMGKPGKICACVKHFAGYGGAEAGRDYNTVQLSHPTLYDFYLRAYRAGIAAGAGMVMTSFNTIDDKPASTNEWLMRHVLREQMGFDGVLISDFGAIKETIAHGTSEDEKDAARQALIAGVDIDMMTGCYAANLAEMVKEGTVSEKLIDEAVMRILLLKNKLGLFENPFRGADPDMEKKCQLTTENRMLARKQATESFVLLKNNGILPLGKDAQKIAFIGPYCDNRNMISSWAVTGRSDDTVTIREAAEKAFGDGTEIRFEYGVPTLGKDQKYKGFEQRDEADRIFEDVEKNPQRHMDAAINLSSWADTVVLCIGEHFLQSGEATSRTDITIPKRQKELISRVTEVNKNVVILLFSGRPLVIRDLVENPAVQAILEVWMPGSEGGNAIVDVLTGVAEPGGRLPMSFPYCIGQIPVYYNHFSTGRPKEGHEGERFFSGFRDAPNGPLYEFGYGLTYTDFEVSKEELSCEELTEDGSITVSARIRNIGSRKGTAVVQMYIQDVIGSQARPVKELKGIRRELLLPGEEKKITFTIDEPMLRFYDGEGNFRSEPGNFRVFIGLSSNVKEAVAFRLV
jgi:beta-glucosidase